MSGVQLVQERVRRFISENFYVSDAAELADDASLIASGVIDSTGVLELIAFLEQEYAISIEEAEVTPDNLETIGSIVRFVAEKKFSARTVAHAAPR